MALAVLTFPQALGLIQPPSFLQTNRATTLSSCRSIASINGERPSSCLQASTEGSGAEAGAQKTARAAATVPLSLPTLLEEGPLRILDPDVRETDDGYALTFNLPAEVTEDGLDLSVRLVILAVELGWVRCLLAGSRQDSESAQTPPFALSVLPPMGAVIYISLRTPEMKIEQHTYAKIPLPPFSSCWLLCMQRPLIMW